MTRTLTIERRGGHFVVDDKTRPGSPRKIGTGHTMHSAIGDWLVSNQTALDLAFHVDDSAKPSEERRRKRELAKR